MQEKTTRHYEWFKKIQGITIGSKGSSTRDPIVVNELYEIIEGQDRFEYWRKRELPVRYVVIPGLGRWEAKAYARAFQ